MNINVVNIDGKEYMEVDKAIIKDTTYVFLTNVNDLNDFSIRKLALSDGKVYYDGLKDNEEFDLALMYFIKNHKNILEEEN